VPDTARCDSTFCQEFKQEERLMTDKKKGKHPITKPTKVRKDELSEKDLDKASGGWNGGVGDAKPQT
jgi:hypothetical protein